MSNWVYPHMKFLGKNKRPELGVSIAAAGFSVKVASCADTAEIYEKQSNSESNHFIESSVGLQWDR